MGWQALRTEFGYRSPAHSELTLVAAVLPGNCSGSAWPSALAGRCAVPEQKVSISSGPEQVQELAPGTCTPPMAGVGGRRGGGNGRGQHDVLPGGSASRLETQPPSSSTCSIPSGRCAVVVIVWLFRWVVGIEIVKG